MVSKDITIMSKEEQITIKAKKMARVLQALNEINEIEKIVKDTNLKHTKEILLEEYKEIDNMFFKTSNI